MKSGSGVSGNSKKMIGKEGGEENRRDTRNHQELVDQRGCPLNIVNRRARLAEDVGNLPAKVLASVTAMRGEYDARRLRSQREVIRDVMLAAADCDTWLTLGELRGLTRYGEASISAQLRHLRKSENGGYEVAKRQREDLAAGLPRGDERGECVWEYRVGRGLHPGLRTETFAMQAVSTGSTV